MHRYLKHKKATGETEMITGNRVRIRRKTIDDAERDYAWQCDPELARLDAVSPLDMHFHQFLNEYNFGLTYASNDRREYAIETLDGEHIGNCVYYDIDNRRKEAEFGIMIGNKEYWGKGYGTDSVSTLLHYIFSVTRLNRIYLKSLEWNERAHRCFLNCGFKPCGRMVRDGYSFRLFELYRSDWQKLHEIREGKSGSEKQSATTR